MSELKPCPVCGGADISRGDDEFHWSYCFGCSAEWVEARRKPTAGPKPDINSFDAFCDWLNKCDAPTVSSAWKAGWSAALRNAGGGDE